MEDKMNYAAFLSYSLIQIFTPGPNNIMAMNNAVRFGIRRSFGFDLGVMAGFSVIMTISCLSSAALYKMIPAIKPIVTALGAAYIFYLAWKTYKSNPTDKSGKGQITTFFPGMMVQFLNPKGVLMALTAASVYITPNYDAFTPMLALSVLLGGLCLISTLTWGLFGTLFQRFYEGHHKAVNAVMALLLLYCAVSLFL